MKAILHVALAFAVGFMALWGLQSCHPFRYLMDDEKPLIRGGVQS